MAGLEGWVYPYQKVIIDDKIGEIVGFWKQIVNDPDDRKPPSGRSTASAAAGSG